MAKMAAIDRELSRRVHQMAGLCPAPANSARTSVDAPADATPLVRPRICRPSRGYDAVPPYVVEGRTKCTHWYESC